MFIFVETKLFTRLFDEMFSDDAELAKLQDFLSVNPEVGDIIPGSGGVRKMRWAAPGRGKRGGVRIIYYLRSKQGQIWLLTLYPKSETDNIPGPILKQIKDDIDGDI
jgi:mRNA-degrading endonuclease RelE of RelBE toxin-antitoxin system